MSERLDRLEALSETILLAIQQQQQQQQQDRTEWREGINDVVSMVASLAQHMEEMQSEVRGLQLENRRILDHLFNQGN